MKHRILGLSGVLRTKLRRETLNPVRRIQRQKGKFVGEFPPQIWSSVRHDPLASELGCWTRVFLPAECSIHYSKFCITSSASRGRFPTKITYFRTEARDARLGFPALKNARGVIAA